MKNIILDHFRRWRVVMILFGTIFFLFAGSIEREGGSEMLATPFNALINHAIFYVYIFQLLIFFLGFFLTTNLQCGLARVLTTLPITTKQIGRALWLASVAIPAAALTVIGFLALIVFSIRADKAMPFGNYLAACVIAAPTLGAMFGAMTLSTTAIPETFFDRIRALFSNVFMMLPIFGMFLFDKKNPNTTEAILIFSALTILTVIGWFRAEQLVVNHAGFRITSRQLKKIGEYKPSTGFGGIRYIFATAFFGIWSFGVYFLIIMNLLDFVIKHQFDWHHLTRTIDNGGAFFPLFFGLIVMRSGFLSHNLRFLRTMPISTARLAATLLSVQILPLLTLCMAFTALAWNETGSAECISFFKIELLAVAPLSVFIAVSIWNTQGNFIKAVLLAIAILAPLTLTFYQLSCVDGRGLPFWFIILFSVVMVGISFWSTCQILAKSSSAYRPPPNQLGTRWGWGAGR